MYDPPPALHTILTATPWKDILLGVLLAAPVTSFSINMKPPPILYGRIKNHIAKRTPCWPLNPESTGQELSAQVSDSEIVYALTPVTLTLLTQVIFITRTTLTQCTSCHSIEGSLSQRLYWQLL